MSGTGQHSGSPLTERNSETITAELGETSTPGFNPSPVTPYSIPVAGGSAYICGTGHAHTTYGAAERCGGAGTVKDGPVHADYPHDPGYLFDCPACEERCHCTPGNAECVWSGHDDDLGEYVDTAALSSDNAIVRTVRR